MRTNQLAVAGYRMAAAVVSTRVRGLRMEKEEMADVPFAMSTCCVVFSGLKSS